MPELPEGTINAFIQNKNLAKYGLLKDNEGSHFSFVGGGGFHQAKITGLGTCVRKPLVATVAAEWSRLTIGCHTGMALPYQRSGAPPPISPCGGLRRRSVIARRHSVGN